MSEQAYWIGWGVLVAVQVVVLAATSFFDWDRRAVEKELTALDERVGHRPSTSIREAARARLTRRSRLHSAVYGVGLTACITGASLLSRHGGDYSTQLTLQSLGAVGVVSLSLVVSDVWAAHRGHPALPVGPRRTRTSPRILEDFLAPRKLRTLRPAVGLSVGGSVLAAVLVLLGQGDPAVPAAVTSVAALLGWLATLVTVRSLLGRPLVATTREDLLWQEVALAATVDRLVRAPKVGSIAGALVAGGAACAAHPPGLTVTMGTVLMAAALAVTFMSMGDSDTDLPAPAVHRAAATVRGEVTA